MVKSYVVVKDKPQELSKMYIGISFPYTILNYIESTGDEFIDTGVMPNQDTRMDIVAQFADNANSSDVLGVAGCRTASSNNFWIGWGGSDVKKFFAKYNDKTSIESSEVNFTAKHHFSLNKNIFYVDGVAADIAGTVGTFQASNTIALFSIYNGPLSLYRSPVKIYSCKIYDNGNIIRDFIPCKRNDDVVGLYDRVTKEFYVNARSEGEFIAGNEVRPSYQNKARKVKKAYIGVNGVAKPIFSSGKLENVGTATDLSAGRRWLAATSIGKYALFGGGESATNVVNNVDAYDALPTKQTNTAPLNEARYYLTATFIENYAIFAGGIDSVNRPSSQIDAYYKDSLERIENPPILSVRRWGLASASNGKQALIGGGYTNTDRYALTASARVEVLSGSITRSDALDLSVARGELSATSIGDFVLFGGGHGDSYSGYKDVVDAYDTTLTRCSITPLVNARSELASTNTKKYAFFGGGIDNSAGCANEVDVYDSMLIKYSSSLGWNRQRYRLTATSIENYAIFAGGVHPSGESVNFVDVFDEFLTRTNYTLSVGRDSLASTSIGNCALFGGGDSNSGSVVATVDMFKVI